MELAGPAHDPAITATSSAPPVRRSSVAPIPVLEPSPGGAASQIAETLDHRRPPAVYAITALVGYLCLAGAAIGLGALLTQVILAGNGLSADDEHISSWFARQRTPTLDDLTYVGSLIGDIPVLPGLVVIAVIVFLCTRRYLAAAFIATAGLLELATYRVTSLVIHRDRPLVPRMDHLPVHQSYPSGHVAASIAVYGGLALLISSAAHRRWVSIVVWSLAVVLPAFVATSRVYRGMHHVTDVAAGVLVGLGALLFALLAARACNAAVRRRSTTTTEETS
jgi:membrane-associated phospholipid phosphatase